MSAKENDVINEIEIARRLVPYAHKEFPGAQVYLFGSYAKGCATKKSDIDIAILVDDFPEEMTIRERWEKECSIIMAAFEIDDRIESTLRPLSDRSGIVANILETGIRVA